MFLVRLVRWKQPLRHVRAYNRTNSFFLSARTPWNKYFPFFLFSLSPSLPRAYCSRIFATPLLSPVHEHVARNNRSKHLFLRSTVELDRTPVFGIYRLFPFLISSRTSLLSPQMEIIIRPIIFAKGSVRTTVCCSFGKYTIRDVRVFLKKKTFRYSKRTIRISLFRGTSRFLSFFENELNRVFIRGIYIVAFANFAPIQKI